MANNWRTSLLIVILTSFAPLACGQSRPPQHVGAAGISQLIEERDGRVSCWGVFIQLARLSFPATLQPSAIEMTDAKHDRSLKDVMEWQVDPTRKRLTIRFRPGMGDFGTGNRIEIRIKRDALNAGAGVLAWVLETDPL